MGHTVQEPIKEYWSANKPCYTPLYSEVKIHDQFMRVMKVIHFVYNQNPPDRANEDYDRSWKIRKIISCLNSTQGVTRGTDQTSGECSLC